MAIIIHYHLTKGVPVARYSVRDDESFREAEHPRESDGQFAPKGQGSTTKAPAAPKAAPKWTKAGGGDFTPPEHARLRALKVPPAWTSVKLYPEHSAIQVTGVDVKGRTQRKYSAEHSEKAAAEKFARLKSFNAVVGNIVTSASSDMNNSRLAPVTRDAAAVVKLIALTGFRIGSERDTGADKQAYGASTLTREHVQVKGDTITFNFTGKKGVEQSKTITDAGLAKYVRGRIGTKEDRLRHYDAKLFNASPMAIRSYLKSRGGTEFKPKDFRTWNGTNAALKVISTMPVPKDEKEFARQRLEVGKAVAKHLGNTPIVALAAYIDPAVFGQWRH
jgi:DNA topoisomerase-1